MKRIFWWRIIRQLGEKNNANPFDHNFSFWKLSDMEYSKISYGFFEIFHMRKKEDDFYLIALSVYLLFEIRCIDSTVWQKDDWMFLNNRFRWSISWMLKKLSMCFLIINIDVNRKTIDIIDEFDSIIISSF